MNTFHEVLNAKIACNITLYIFCLKKSDWQELQNRRESINQGYFFMPKAVLLQILYAVYCLVFCAVATVALSQGHCFFGLRALLLHKFCAVYCHMSCAMGTAASNVVCCMLSHELCHRHCCFILNCMLCTATCFVLWTLLLLIIVLCVLPHVFTMRTAASYIVCCVLPMFCSMALLLPISVCCVLPFAVGTAVLC